jgi:hypothetical protein
MMRWMRLLALILMVPTGAGAGDGESGPIITYFGIASPSDYPIAPNPEMENGRVVYSWPQGYGISVVIEAAPGENRRAVGTNAYAHDPEDPIALPDLQVLASYRFGNGDPAVCEMGDAIGIPAIESLVFDGSATVAAAINDFGCRVDNGLGDRLARVERSTACTRNANADFDFVVSTTQAQFCAFIARSFELAFGDTVLAARVRDADTGTYGPRQEIVVRVTGFGPTATPAATNTPAPSNTPTPSVPPSATPTDSAPPTATMPPPCPGDCSGNRIVTVNELVTGVNIALEQASIDACPNADRDGSGTVFVDELTRAVRALLDGCD